MEQRERSADTVSCQPLSALASLRESHWRSSTPAKPKIWPHSSVCPGMTAGLLNVCMCVYMQVGSCQSDLPISSPPDRPAAAQCCLLCHRGTPAGLLGYTQTGDHPIYTTTERAVSASPFFLTPHFKLTHCKNLLVLSSGKSLYLGFFCIMLKIHHSSVWILIVPKSHCLRFFLTVVYFSIIFACTSWSKVRLFFKW